MQFDTNIAVLYVIVKSKENLSKAYPETIMRNKCNIYIYIAIAFLS